MKLSAADQELIKLKYPTFQLSTWNSWLEALEKKRPQHRYWLWVVDANWDEDGAGPFIIDGLDVNEWISQVSEYIGNLSEATYRTKVHLEYLHSKLSVPDYDIWGKLATRSDFEFLLLSQKIDPDEWRKIPQCLANLDIIRPLIGRYRSVLKSHVDAGVFEQNSCPSNYLRWAEQYDFDFPEEMGRAVRPLSPDGFAEERQNFEEKIKQLQLEANKQLALANKPDDNSIQIRKLYILLIAMASDKYSYYAGNNAAAKQIVGAVELLASRVDPADANSISITDDSVRNHLNRAIGALDISVHPKTK